MTGLTRDLFNVLGTVADKGATVRSLSDPWADIASPHGRLMPTVPGSLAGFHRELIRTRTGEDRAQAKKEGRKMGHPRKLTADQRQEVREAGETLTSIVRSYNVHHATVGRL